MESEALHHSPREAAVKLGVSVSTVWRRIHSGHLPTIQAAPPGQPGRKPQTRVTHAALSRFVQERSHVA